MRWLSPVANQRTKLAKTQQHFSKPPYLGQARRLAQPDATPTAGCPRAGVAAPGPPGLRAIEPASQPFPPPGRRAAARGASQPCCYPLHAPSLTTVPTAAELGLARLRRVLGLRPADGGG